MGNAVLTCDLPMPAIGKPLRSLLSTNQIHLVQSSWDLIKCDLHRLGRIVFVRFFETHPSMKSVFPKIVQMNSENKLEYNIDEEMLQKHALTVMEGLGAAVESLDDSHFLNGVLISIGQTHTHRSIKPYMLKKLWPSLNYGLHVVLEDAYSKEVAEAWKKVYEYICAYMQLGMENPDMDPDRPLPRKQ